jgi:hypothetical protein
MNFLDHVFPPAQVAELSGVSVDSLRDWRRRNILEGFGAVQANGRWLYSATEILTFAIARVLELNGQSIIYALWMAHECVLQVINKIRPIADYQNFAQDYVIFWLDKAGTPWIRTADFELQFLPTNNLADIVKTKAPSVFVVDTQNVAEALKPELTHAVLYGVGAKAGDEVEL